MQPIVNKSLISNERLNDLKTEVHYSHDLKMLPVPVCTPKINKQHIPNLNFETKTYRLKALSERDVLEIKAIQTELKNWKKDCSKFTVRLIEMTSYYLSEALRIKSEDGDFDWDHCLIAVSINDCLGKHELHNRITGISHCEISGKTLKVSRVFSNPKFYDESESKFSVRGSGRALVQSALNYSKEDADLEAATAYPENPISAHIFDTLNFSVINGTNS